MNHETRVFKRIHYTDVIMGAIASQITSLTIVYSTVYSNADQRKHQSSASLAFVWGIHRGPVNSPHKWPVTRKMFSFDDVIMRHTWAVKPQQPKLTVYRWCGILQITLSIFCTSRTVFQHSPTFPSCLRTLALHTLSPHISLYNHVFFCLCLFMVILTFLGTFAWSIHSFCDFLRPNIHVKRC